MQINLNQNWKFGGKNMGVAAADPKFNDSAWQAVNIPHDWNALGGSGVGEYCKSLNWYRKTITLTAEEAEQYNLKTAYLKFGSGSMETELYFNGKHVGSHKGGWSAFTIPITRGFVEGNNIIALSTGNIDNPDIAPLHGDFNRDSGLTRDIELQLLNPIHFERVKYGVNGVRIVPIRTNEHDEWQVGFYADVCNNTALEANITLKATIKHPASFDHSFDEYFPVDKLQFDPNEMFDPLGTIIGSAQCSKNISSVNDGMAIYVEGIKNPKLWDGITCPYQYIAVLELYHDGELVDVYETFIGFRHYEAVRKKDTYDAEGNGFYLNGKFYPLRGVGMHYDWPGIGRALTPRHIAADIGCLYEMGANWVRTSHYPHPPLTYEILSRYGIACSAEIPLIDGVGMTEGKKNGKLSGTFKELTLRQMREMIHQLYNYPAILGWLLQNELGGGTYGQGYGEEALAAQIEMMEALNTGAKQEDEHRPAIMAMSLPHCYNFDGCYLLWNNYPGWYSVTQDGIGTFVDKYKDHDTKEPKRPTGVSEYGAGINPFEHYDFHSGAKKPAGTGDPWHPEEYGNDRHEVSLREINARPFYWATAAWIMYDFSAAIRNEGGRAGINDKGIVRKERPQDMPSYSGNPQDLLFRKDVFYLYKANWNSEALTYIASRRYNPRPQRNIVVTLYSNADKVVLLQNGKTVGEKQKTVRTDGAETGSCIFKFDMSLMDGENTILAIGYDVDGNKVSDDKVIWTLQEIVTKDVEQDTSLDWRIYAKKGAKIFIDNDSHIIYVPDDVPDFYPGGYMGGGMVFTNVGASIVVEGNCRAVFSNDVDYSLMETSRYIITDALGNETVYTFKFFQGDKIG